MPYSVGGAGGKGTWGKLTELYDEDGRTHDFKDPNYDSIEEDVCCMVYYNNDIMDVWILVIE